MKKLTILIPSRNRYRNLLQLISSIEDIQTNDVELSICISDNSDQAYEKITSNKVNLKVIRPPTRLSMVDHWNWIIGENESEYYSIITDRSIICREYFEEAIKLIVKQEYKVVSYSFAGYSDHYFPYYIGSLGYTFKSHEILSKDLISDAKKCFYWQSFPRALNCIFHVDVVKNIKEKFITVFSGVSPDVNFAFKVLATENIFLFLDKPVFLSAGNNLSNGRKSVQGKSTQEQMMAIDKYKSAILPSYEKFPYAINGITHEFESVIGIDGLSMKHFYARLDKEANSARYGKLILKLTRLFTLIKSYRLALSIIKKLKPLKSLNKIYIFE